MSTYLILIVIELSIVGWLAYSGSIRLPGDREYIHPDLLKAANGSRSLAKRLLKQARLKYPDKSDRWCREKVIYDLNRDRGVIKARRNMFNVRSWTHRETREKLITAGLFLWVANRFISLIDRLRR